MTKDYERKGLIAEEALRSYFLEMGYFAVRGAPFFYKSLEVTDVDIWLYVKSSSFSRERACVDIKRKRSPQTLERVLWTKGLREVLGVERAIVVTTDNRMEPRDFGAMNGVIVLHGDFLQRVLNGYKLEGRITEEGLFALLTGPCIVDKSVIWARWYRTAKGRLLQGLDFNSCNSFLMDIHLLLQEFIATGGNSPRVVRLLYLLISYFLLSLDYASRSIAQLETNERKAHLTNGLRYGEAGQERTEEVIDMALRILAASGKADSSTKTNIRREFQEQLDVYPAEILGEYFSRPESLKHLFDLARDFEGDAFATNLVLPPECRSEHKAIIGLLCDFLGMDRK
ncbi:MAG: hypothetical protein MOB07_23440, partial [Acidobacteria bacterium]|nr:hypothetical protein [Acidobacteriota bacterium]